MKRDEKKVEVQAAIHRAMEDRDREGFTGSLTITLHYRSGGIGKAQITEESSLIPNENAPGVAKGRYRED